MAKSKLQIIEENNRITVGALRKRLQGYPDETEITFGCTTQAIPLVFFRTKIRGPRLVGIELTEVFPDEVHE